MVLPESTYDAIKEQFEGDVGSFHYARVYMTLGEIIDGDFFNDYIKTGRSTLSVTWASRLTRL